MVFFDRFFGKKEQNEQSVTPAETDVISQDTLHRLFTEFFSPNAELYSDIHSEICRTFIGAVNAAKEELCMNPVLFKAATKWESSELFRFITEDQTGLPDMTLCGLVIAVACYAVREGAVFCIDHADRIPNCIALYLMLKARKKPAEQRVQLIDAGVDRNIIPLSEAMNALKVCDPAWDFRIITMS